MAFQVLREIELLWKQTTEAGRLSAGRKVASFTTPIEIELGDDDVEQIAS